MKAIVQSLKVFSLLFVTAFFVGCNDDDGVELPTLVASFTHTIDQDTGKVTFINTSENADTYSWDFGDGTSSNLVNPMKFYPGGVYTVTLTASNAAGATDTFEDVITIFSIASVPFNFDNATTIYNPSVFNGASFAIVDNPAPGGSNNVASQVGAITNSGNAFEGLIFSLGQPVDLSMDMTILIDVWSDQAVPVLLKLEQGTGPDTEVVANHTGSGWEQLIFTFNSTDSFSGLTLFIDGPGNTSGTFYIDNITQSVTIDTTPPVITLNGDATVTLTAGESFTDPGATANDNFDGDISGNIVVGGDTVDTDTPGTYVITYNVMDATGNVATEVIRTVIVEPCSDTNNLEFPIDFDCPTIDYAAKIVGNVSFEVIDNPEMSGINAMDTKVGRIVNVGANWENAFFNLDTPLDFSMDKGIRFKMFSTVAVPVLLKFEDGTEAPVEVSADHTGSGWEELTFEFTSSASYNDMVIFVDGPGTTAGTFYVDDLEQYAPDTGGGGGNESPYCNTSVFHLGIPAEVASEVLVSIFNVDATTMRIEVKSANDDPVDALVLPAGDFNPIPGISMAPADVGDGVWAAEFFYPAGAPTNAELYFLWSKVSFGGNWQFGGPGADLISVPFDATCDTSGGGGGGGGSEDTLILDFENNLAGVTTAEFETSGMLIANPVSGGINTSPNVYQAAWTNGNQWWGGVGFTFADGVLDQSVTTYKVKFYSTVAPTNVLFQVEVDGTNAPVGQVQEITTANEWVELEFTLSGVPAGVNRILVRPDVGDQTGTKPNTGTLYIDDIFSTAGSGGGGGGGGGTGGGGCTGDLVPAASLPVDFEGCETFPAELNFGSGLTSELADNPSTTGNSSSFALKVDKPAGSDFFAGVQNNFASNFPDLTMNSFRMKIYSTKANTTFRFEVAQDDPGVGNPPPAFVTVADANTWTEVNFSFTSIPAPTSYFRLVIKPDNDEMDSAITEGGTYYFDDIELIN